MSRALVIVWPSWVAAVNCGAASPAARSAVRAGERSAEAQAATLKAEELRQAHQRLLSQAPEGAKGKALRDYQQQVRAADRLATKAEEAARRFFEQRFTEWLRGDLKLGRDVTVDIRWTE
jgi:hypothetical protein